MTDQPIQGTVHQYQHQKTRNKVKVENQNHKIKIDNKFNSTVQQYTSKMYRLPES